MTEQWQNDPKARWWARNSAELQYGTQEKIRKLSPLFKELDAGGALGTKMLEVGTGADSPLNYLIDYSIPHRTMLGIDVMPVSKVKNPEKQLQYDVREIGEPWSRETIKKIVEAANKLGVESPLPKEPLLDSIFFFEILNYVDYKTVIQNCARFLKPGGRIVILNHPQRRPPDFSMVDFHSEADGARYDARQLFDEHGAKSNRGLEQFVREYFDMEPGYPQFPWGLEESVGRTPGEDLTFMFLVARKR